MHNERFSQALANFLLRVFNPFFPLPFPSNPFLWSDRERSRWLVEMPLQRSNTLSRKTFQKRGIFPVWQIGEKKSPRKLFFGFFRIISHMSRTDTSSYYSINFHFFVSDKITGKGKEKLSFSPAWFFSSEYFFVAFFDRQASSWQKTTVPDFPAIKKRFYFSKQLNQNFFTRRVYVRNPQVGRRHAPCTHTNMYCIPSPLSRSRQTNWFLLLLRYQTANKEFEKRKVFLPSFFFASNTIKIKQECLPAAVFLERRKPAGHIFWGQDSSK